MIRIRLSVSAIGRRKSRRLSALSFGGSVLLAVSLLASTVVPPEQATADTANDSVLVRQPQLQPSAQGNGSTAALQYADPGVGQTVIAPPEPNSQGSAQLHHPLLIPSGRGIQPALDLTYDSSAGSSWVGTGWDLSVGEIGIETRWGVPRYDPQKETETYVLDGQTLSPTAIRSGSDFQPRVAERSDFTSRVETSYNLIIRHGDNPQNYWWEVRDKSGGIRWYGGFPDDGGPDVNAVSSKYPSLKQDPSAILFDNKGNAYRWALSAQRDVGVNLIRYFYETIPGQRVGSAGASIGRQLYLSRIRYTEAASAAPAPVGDAAYEVRFLRGGLVSPGATPRKDISVNARGGFLEVTSDLLQRVEVWFGVPNGGNPRSYDTLSRRYDLHYIEGAFGKTLLSSVDQIGSDGNVYASHAFTYFDQVRDASGTYNGWGPEVPWNTGTDNLQQNLITPVGVSVLGGSETNSGDVHAYLGFNPEDPTKEGSFGGAFAISGGATEADAEFIDINGDGLPDKVFRQGGTVWYRLNTSGPNLPPGAQATFSEMHPVIGLSRLSTEANIGLAGDIEAHFGVDVQFTISGDITIGEAYFADVNGDGLPDFVSGGTVYFNHLDPITGNPTFEPSSANTPAPINTTSTTLPVSQQITDLENQRRAQSPLQDTVSRWVAPFNGTIAITAPATLDPSMPGDPIPPPPYKGDGVTVAIQLNASQLWNATLKTPGATATPTNVSAINVVKGDHIYFRLQSIDDGARDQVRWDPKIAYTFTAPTDANGLSQIVFQQSQDFTLAGRPHTLGAAPLGGTLHFQGTLRKTTATTDDVTVQVLKNGVTVFSQLVPAATVNAAGISLASGTATAPDITVAAPTTVNNKPQVDKLEVKIAADSPIDVSAVQLDYQLYYVKTDNPSIPLTDSSGKPTIALQIPADTDIYPQNTLTAPNTPWVSDLARTVTVHASLNVAAMAASSTAGDVVVTVKTATGLVGKKTVAVVPNTTASQTVTADFDVPLMKGTSYWFDFSIRNPDISDKASGQAVQLRWTDNGAKTENVPSVLNAAGRQGYFPLSYRGWGFAGYNGDGARAAQPIDETAFVVNPADFPPTPAAPSGFGDTTFRDASKGPGYAFVPFHVQATDATGKPLGSALAAWRGMKDDIIGAAGLMRSSRSGVDSPSLGVAAGGGIQAVRRVGIAAPTFSLNVGVGPVGASFGAGPSFGLQDYVDMNGDGFPDIVGPGYIKFTDPRGGFYDSGSGVSVVNQDTSFAVGGGLNASPIDIKSNSKGSVHTAQTTPPGSGTKKTSNSSAQTGGSAAESQYGYNVGGQIGISATFTNPGAPDPNVSKTPLGPPDPTAPLEQTLVDVNGDGLPDRVTQTPQGVFVEFNLGYGFAPAIPWSSGGFENNESYAGSIGPQLGFTTPERDFSAGLGLSESINIPRYAWIDVNGDGILDRLHKDAATGQVLVAFGTNSGLLPDVPYGPMASGTFPLAGGSIPVGQQIALDDSTGLGAGFDFTIGIGPLCIVACYLIVNPGVHFDHTVSSTQIALVDVDGDGYPDVVKSTADNQVTVRFNLAGKTNLLQAVHNPLGGTISLDFQRDGNTVAQPTSIWTLSRVQVNDGRPGDGVDVNTSTYTYSGGRFDRLEREMLGYGSVVEHQLAADGSTVRSIEDTYLNDNVFDGGLPAKQVLRDANGTALQETDTTWSLIDLKTQQPANLSPTAADPAGVRLFGMAVGPLSTRVDQFWSDAAHNPGEHTSTTFTYDALGNPLTQVELGQPELSTDAITATMQYTSCNTAFNSANYTRVHPSCPAPQLPGGVPPFWSSTRCPTWTSLPTDLAISTTSSQVLRHRNGAPALCDNSSVTDQREFLGTGSNDFVQSLLSYDAWGNYNHIEYPCPTIAPQNACASNQRATVDYVYDDNSHGVIAQVTDSHGLQATATFDGRTGQIAKRTDANNQVTLYTYDAFSRIASITGPYEQDTGHPTVSFEYHADNPNYAYAVAHNFDVRHPGNTIDTATFIDGIGRPTQTKQDATLFTGLGSPPGGTPPPAMDAMVVSAAMDFDALGRAVTVRYPVSEPLGSIGTYNTDKSGLASTITYDAQDRPTQVQVPSDPGGPPLVTKTDYSFGNYTSVPYHSGVGASLFKTTVIDPLGKAQTTWADVRGNVWAVDNSPAPGSATTTVLSTQYQYDPLGQLLQVKDSGGNVTTYSYDMLGRQTSSTTPDGGQVDNVFDGAGNMVAQITPNLRAKGERVTYSYDIDRLAGISYPLDSGTPNVAFTYGGPGAPGNAAGRVTTAVDGARTQQLTYDQLGAVASEIAVMNLHNGPSAPLTTNFTHDGFGRLLSVTYPDGEVLTNQYDSGGLLSSIEGVKGNLVTDYVRRQEYDVFQNRRYREFGNGVHTEYSFYRGTLHLKQQVTTTPQRKIQDLNYGYDSVGNVKTVVNKADGPQPGLLGGPSTQNYSYDGYYRLQSANGSAPQAPNKLRSYTYAVGYDSSGNIASKNQHDVVSGVTSTGAPTNPMQVQSETSYNWNFTYKPAPTGGPHQIATAGGNSYSFDPNGNFATLTDAKGHIQRTVTWDAANRARNINDASSSTDYLYDAQGLLGVRRDSLGETAFVNNWYQFTNGGWFWKEIFADGDRIAQATEQVDATTGLLTPLDYYEHQDLQGSTNVVTDQTGLEFEHMEYFPSGEIWIHENSTTHRTPYRYVGDYNDEVRGLDLMGQRWYQPREQIFLSPEPLLSSQPGQSIADPGLLPAYTYAESNGLRLYDANGTAPRDSLSRLRNRFADYQANRTSVAQGGLPEVPSITVTTSADERSGGIDFGGHATVYLAVPSAADPTRLDYRRIDIKVDDNNKSAFHVRILDAEREEFGRWPDPSVSTTWEIGNDQARAALDRATHLKENEASYKYGVSGLGLNRYNCAQIAENVLQGAGIKQSAGLVFATPLEVATGQKVPRLNVSGIVASLKSSVARQVNKLTRFLPKRQAPIEVPAMYRDI